MSAKKRRAPGKPQTRRPGKPRRTKGQRARSIVKLLTVLGLVGLLVGVGAFVVLYKAIDIPEPNAAFQAQTTFVYYKDGKTQLGTYYEDQNRESIPLSEMPESIQDAVVAAENQSFWTDKGLDPKGILRALFSNASGGPRQGASTITQQYVKILYLTSDRTYKRKIKEAVVSLKIQQDMSKQEVLEGYLNTIYFGRGAYGIQAASKAYFNRPASKLNLRQSAVLASVLNNPAKFDPANGDEARDDLKVRYGYVLSSMAKMGTITAAERDEALKSLPKFPKVEAQSQFGGQKGHVMALVKKEILARGIASEEEIDGGGLRITTTLDEQVMADIEESVTTIRPGLVPYTDINGKLVKPKDSELHAAAATVDVRSGALLGFYGGQDYLESQINWAVAGGQAGSTFKAAGIVAGLREGFALKDTFEGNSPIEVEDGTTFENQGDTDYGSAVSLTKATEDSINTAFIDLVDALPSGPSKVIKAAEDMGIPRAEGEDWGIPNKSVDIQENLGVVLGSGQVSPINMANAYATLANGGVRSDVHILEKVVDRNGETLYDAKPRQRRTIDEDVAADTTYALQKVVEEGSGALAGEIGRPVAGKTGTATNDKGEVTSSWFVGTTPQVSTAVMYVRGKGREELDGPVPASSDGRAGYFGGNYPTKTWAAIMGAVMEGMDVEEFPEPAFLDGDAPETGHEYTPPPPKPKPTKTKTPTPKPTPTETPTETPTPTPTETPTPTPTPTPTFPTGSPTPTDPSPSPSDSPSPTPGSPGNGKNGRVAVTRE